MYRLIVNIPKSTEHIHKKYMMLNSLDLLVSLGQNQITKVIMLTFNHYRKLRFFDIFFDLAYHKIIISVIFLTANNVSIFFICIYIYEEKSLLPSLQIWESSTFSMCPPHTQMGFHKCQRTVSIGWRNSSSWCQSNSEGDQILCLAWWFLQSLCLGRHSSDLCVCIHPWIDRRCHHTDASPLSHKNISHV